MSSFADSISNTIFSFEGTDEPREVCHHTIDHYWFYQISTAPAVIIYVILTFFEKRRHLLPQILDGRPGLVHPMDVLTREMRISYCCAFGAIASLCLKIVTESQYAFAYTGTTEFRVFVIMASILIYGVSLSPMFVCLAVNSILSFGLGTLYVWTYSAVKFFMWFECRYTKEVTGLLILRNLPEILFLAYMCVSFPVRFFYLIYTHRAKTKTESVYKQQTEEQLVEDIRESYHGLRMKRLLRKHIAKKDPQNVKEKIVNLVMTVFHKLIYIKEPGFRYSARILAIYTVGLAIVYSLSCELMAEFVILFDLLLASVVRSIETTVGWYAVDGETGAEAMTRANLVLTWYLIYCLKVCLIVSIVVASTTCIVMSLHALCAYRTNLNALHRGDHKLIPPSTTMSFPSLMAGSMRFAGYQVAYMTWGWIVLFAVLYLISVILAFFIICMINGIFVDFVIQKILKLWPAVILGLVINFSQVLVSRFFFLQKCEGNIVLGMDNRRAFFLLNYFIYFYNIFLGMVSCLLRVIKSLILGSIFLCRLDISTLPRKFEALDPGFQAYIGFMHVENAHTHPGAIIFCRIMSIPVNLRAEYKRQTKHKDAEMGEKEMEAYLEKRRNRDRAINNWQLMYTLFNNPELRVLRKGYYQKKLKNPKQYREEYLKTFQDADGAVEMKEYTKDPNGVSTTDLSIRL